MSFGGSAPVQKDLLSEEMERIGAEEWDRYKQDFAPREKEFIGAVSELGSPREQEYLRGVGSAELKQQRGLPAPTNRPGAVLGQALSGGQSQANLATSTTLAGADRKAKGLGTAISLGRDIGAGALGQLGRESAIQRYKNTAAAEAAGLEKQSKYEALGTLAGGAASYFAPRGK